MARSTGACRSRVWLVVALAAFVGSCLAFAAPAVADARSEYLIRLLSTSSMFRVRAQAAISLGTVQPEAAVTEALGGALRDENAVVRAAAAASLERQGDAAALPSLRQASRDTEPAVRDAVLRAIAALERSARTGHQTEPAPSAGAGGGGTGPAQFYVGVGLPGSRVPSLDRPTLERARSFISTTASGVPGVVLAPPEEARTDAAREIARRRLTGYYLDSSITSVEARPDGGLRVAVSVLVQSYPDRNLRSMLNGAATVMGAPGSQAQQQAIEGAFRSALRNLAPALQASARAGQ